MNGRWIDVVRLRLRSLFRRDRVESELDRELRAHLAAMVDENIARGMSPAEARRVAARDFGGLDQMKEEARDARGVNFIENVARDLRYTLRGLVREPLLLLAAATSIALGAAGNVAVYSLARELVFAAPDVREPERVVAFRVRHSSHATYRQWRDLDASGVVERVAGFDFGSQVNWFRGDAAVSLSMMPVTDNFFEVLGIPMALGRGFSADEARAENDPRLVVLSHGFWRRELGADSGVLGKALTLNGSTYTIVGVLAPKVRSLAGFGLAPSIYVPFSPTLVPRLLTPGDQAIQLVARLKPDQSVAEARAAIDALDRRLALAVNDSMGGIVQIGVVGTVGDTKRRTLAIFFGMVGVVSILVLLIACANVAGLLMARASTRRSEIAIRLAMGGSRPRLLQQLMIEAFWLSVIGTAAGLALAGIGLRAVNAMTLPIDIPVELHLAIDREILLGALAMVVATTVASALLPSLAATRLSLTPALKRDDRSAIGYRFRTRRVLLAGQVTASTVLLVTAILFVRNLQHSEETRPGFDVDPVLVAQIGLIQGRTPEQQNALLERLTERAGKVAGVTASAYATSVPLTVNGGASSGMMIQFDGQARPRHVEYARAEIGRGYFAAIGIPLVAGRDFSRDDAVGAPRVVVVNELFARRYLDGKAVGRRFRFMDDERPTEYEIVGVVANSKYRTIGEEPRPAMYRPLTQWPPRSHAGFVYARVDGDATSAVSLLRAALGDVDRAVSVSVQPMRAALAFALLPSRVGAAVLGGLGLLGLVLAAFGLFAIVSYNVSRRTSEIAIRSALGASRGSIVGLVIRDASILVGCAVVVGLGIATLATRALSSFLVAGLSAMDPLSFLGTGVVFLLVTLLASWLPARYALRVSPATAMRLE